MMSHNILTVNNNSFDVNSNRTESITSQSFSYVHPSGGFQPTALIVGSNFLFRKDEQVNPSTSWVTQVDHATHTGYVEKFRFTQDGTYRIMARALVPYLSSINALNEQGYYLYNETSSQIVSSSFYHKANDVSYCSHNYMTTIVTRSGSNIDIVVRCFAINREALSGSLAMQDLAWFTAEKLQ